MDFDLLMDLKLIFDLSMDLMLMGENDFLNICLAFLKMRNKCLKNRFFFVATIGNNHNDNSNNIDNN